MRLYPDLRKPAWADGNAFPYWCVRSGRAPSTDKQTVLSRGAPALVAPVDGRNLTQSLRQMHGAGDHSISDPPVVDTPTPIALNRGASRSRIFRFASGLRTTMKSHSLLLPGLDARVAA